MTRLSLQKEYNELLSKNKDVTVRLRDTGEQARIKETLLIDCLKKVIDGGDIFKFGKKVDTRKKEI